MIDLHAHILPGLDDGAPDLETALEMARIAVADGITTMVATPHFIEGLMNNPADLIRRKVDEFQRVLDSEGIHLKVMPGSEVYLDRDTPDLLKKREVMTVNDKGEYLLVELPMGEIPRYAEEVLFEIKVQGVTPIIAHPERNLDFIDNPGLILDFVEKGCLLQINAGSLTGFYGRKVKKTANLLVRNGLIHVVGSDMHSAGERCTAIKRALQMIEELKPRQVEEILEYSIKIADGEKVTANQPVEINSMRADMWRKLVGIWYR